MGWKTFLIIIAVLLMGCAQTDITGCWMTTEGDSISGPFEYFEFTKDGECFPYIYTVPEEYTYESNDTHITLMQEGVQYMTIIEYSLTPNQLEWHYVSRVIDDGEELKLLNREEDNRVFTKVVCHEREPLNIM